MGEKKLVWKKTNKYKILLTVLFVVIYVVAIVGINNNSETHKKDQKTFYEMAKVLEVVEDNTTIDTKTDNIKKGSTVLNIKILTGQYKGKEYTINNYLSAIYNVDVNKGDKVSVRIDERNDGGLDISIYNYNRVAPIVIVMTLFAGMLILVGGKKGAKALVGLVFTLINIVYILLPMTLKGFSPIIVTLSIVLISTIVSFLLLDGMTKKSIIATIGTLCGILIGTLFAMISAQIMHITTYQMEEAEALLLVTSTSKLKMENLLLCGIMISCMGAVMDVAMSITSAIEELHTVNKILTMKELYKSGMNIGKDAIGTMANTLVLAFAGSSLNMLVLISSYGVSFTQLINTDFVALEIIKAVAGSIGIVVTVPLVAVIGGYYYSKSSTKHLLNKR
ncbi:MAG: YibE/F family protein [Lachnospiraceae bacterium]|nr:YibE/F family protein [Lachnospiraceae bacterium]